MRILSIIQPSEMGSDFRFDEEAGLWKVNFPAGMGEGSGVPLSTDANNAIVLGSDEGAFISTDLLGAYALTQDNGSKKINLYRFQPGTEFNPETATLVSSVNMIELSGIFDDVAIDGDLITFTDADTGLTLTIDTANLQKVSDIVGSDSVEVNSLDGLTTLSVKINPHPDNLIEVTEEGLFVDAANFGEGGGDLDLHQTLAQVEDGLCHVVGNSHLVVPQIELVDVAGNAIGYINDIIGLPVSSQTHGPDHCPKWEAPTANNCRVGKVAVALVPYLMYGTGPEDSIEWRIFMNGEDTGYIAAPSKLAPPSEVNQPMLMSLTQNDFGDTNDFIGRGWLEDIISDATNGAISGSYEDEMGDSVTLLNETNQQVILTLVPSRPISLDYIRNVYNDGQGLNIFGLTLDEVTAIRGSVILEVPPTVEKLEDYFDEETGVLSICLAPNGSGNGGSTGPQISCAGATDRFATSGLWYKWTVKLNGKTLVQNARSDDVVQALESKGIRVGYEGETRTTYRNLTDENIRLEFIAGIPDDPWDQIYLELDTSTNPTLTGYDPLQNIAERAMMALGPLEESQEPERYQRITVCLAPADDWMHWETVDVDTSTTVVTLMNSVNLADATQDFRIEGEHNLELETGVDAWGDLTWTIHANEPQRREVILTIDHPDYQDEFTVDFFARKPMVVTLANIHEYARPFNVHSGLEEDTEITAIEVVTKSGSTLISNPEDALTIDAVVGAIRIDSLEDGLFSHIVQGRFVDAELSDKIKVTFTTVSGEHHVVEVNVATNGNDLGYEPISENLNSTVTIGLVDSVRYTDVRTLPTIRIVSPDWSETYLYRTNMVGGEATMEFDFSNRSTYKLYIHAYLGTGAGKLAILGDCVIGVDDWGDVEAEGYTFDQETYAKRFGEDSSLDFLTVSKNNLSYVPKEGPAELRSMVGMFAGTDLSDPSVDLSGYDVRDVYDMAGVFAHSNFNGNILSWGVRWVRGLDYAFYASKFRQDLSLWCVGNISSEPKLFSHRAPLLAKHKPVWGTCPLQGNNNSNEWGEYSLRGEIETNGIRGYGLDDDFLTKVHPDFVAKGPLLEAIAYTPMRYIGKRALKDQEINKITFLEGLLLIDNQALMNNKLTNVTVPTSIKVIGAEAFAGNPMTAITLLGDVPPSLGANALPETVTQVVMSDEAIPAYSKHRDWKQYVGKLKPFSEAVGVLYKDSNGKTGFIPGPEIPEDALQNTGSTIVSISEGVTTLGNDALIGNVAHYLKIPASLTTIDSAGLNVRADILEFSEGFTSNEFMLSSRPSASTLILPSTTTELKGIFVGAFPSVVVCKAMVPPTIETSQYTHALSRYNDSTMRAILVPAAAIAAYQNDPNWGVLTDNFVSLEEFTYGNVRSVDREVIPGPGNSLALSGVITGTADPADAGKTVTIQYFEYIYYSDTGMYVREKIQLMTTVVNADGSFRLETGLDYRYRNHKIAAYIGYGNEVSTDYYRYVN